VSASLDNKLFVTSGLGLTDLSPNSWDVYDPSSNTWHSHRNPMLTADIVKFIAFDGKLYTIHKTAWNSVRFAGVYHPFNKVHFFYYFVFLLEREMDIFISFRYTTFSKV
jgi:N-acetylneuraminic acid mutarotase